MKLNNAKPKKQNAQDWKLSKHGLFSENHFFFYKSFLRLCTVYTLWLCSSLMHHFVWLSVIICHLVVARFHCWGQAHLGLRPSHLRPIWHRPSPFRPSSLRQSPLRPSPIRPSPLRSSPLSPSPLRPSPLRPSPLRPSPLRPSQHRVEMSFNPSGTALSVAGSYLIVAENLFTQVHSGLRPSQLRSSPLNPSQLKPSSLRQSHIRQSYLRQSLFRLLPVRQL